MKRRIADDSSEIRRAPSRRWIRAEIPDACVAEPFRVVFQRDGDDDARPAEMSYFCCFKLRYKRTRFGTFTNICNALIANT